MESIVNAEPGLTVIVIFKVSVVRVVPGPLLDWAVKLSKEKNKLSPISVPVPNSVEVS